MAQDLWNQNQDETYANEPGNMDQRRGFFGNGGAATPFEQMAAGFNADMAAESLSTYIAKTFLWMFVGLLVTFIVAYGMAASGIAYSMLAGAGRAALLVVTVAELAVVIAMSAGINKMAPAVAGFCFLLYAALTGVTFSIYFLAFDLTVLVYAFGATALFFGGMAAASLIFKMELDSIRPYLFGGLILLIVFGILSMFLNLGVFNTLICYVGIAVFLGYTAYDVSKVRQNYYFYAGQGELLKKASIFSALQLYLDFINLFLYILRILGNRKD